MRIALVVPLPKTPCSQRATALFTGLGLALSEQLTQRGHEVTTVPVESGDAQWPSWAGGPLSPDAHLRLAQVFERSDSFDLVYAHGVPAALAFARLVSTPVVAWVTLEMLQAQPAIYRHAGERAFFIGHATAGTDGLRLFAQVPWAVDTGRVPFHANPGPDLAYAPVAKDAEGLRWALSVAGQLGRRLALLGAHPSLVDELHLAELAETGKVMLVEDASSTVAGEVIGQASVLLHVGMPGTLSELPLLEALARGTPAVVRAERLGVGGHPGPYRGAGRGGGSKCGERAVRCGSGSVPTNTWRATSGCTPIPWRSRRPASG